MHELDQLRISNIRKLENSWIVFIFSKIFQCLNSDFQLGSPYLMTFWCPRWIVQAWKYLNSCDLKMVLNLDVLYISFIKAWRFMLDTMVSETIQISSWATMYTVYYIILSCLMNCRWEKMHSVLLILWFGINMPYWTYST